MRRVFGTALCYFLYSLQGFRLDAFHFQFPSECKGEGERVCVKRKNVQRERVVSGIEGEEWRERGVREG